MQKASSFQIKLVSFLMIAIPLVVIFYSFIWENESQRKAAEIGKNVTITKSSARFVEHELLERQKSMVNLASTITRENMNQDYLNGLLKTFKIDEDENYFIAGTDGKVMAYTHNIKPWELPSLKNSPSFREAVKGKALVTGQQKSIFSGEYVVILYNPLYDSSRKVIGVVGDELSIPFFRHGLEPVVIGKTGRLSLIDSQGFYIYDKTIDNKFKPVPANCFWEAKGSDLAIIERISNRRTIYTMVRLKNIGWYVVAFQPSPDITNPGIVTVTKNVLILLLLIVVVIVLWRYKVSLEDRNLLVKRQNAEKLALVGELAAGMAHEIRNPLTAIKGFSQLLKSKDKYAGDKEILELVDDSVDHIEGIVRETLLLAKPQKMEIKAVNLQNIIEETYKFMLNQAVLKEINFKLEDTDLPMFVKGDEIHLKQVLVNIVKNSIEATPKDGQIIIQLRQTDKRTAKITVNDTGIGIKAEVFDKIGTPFFSTKSGGTGLGLSVCHRIVVEHRGVLKIQSKPGKGTTVEIELLVSDN